MQANASQNRQGIRRKLLKITASIPSFVNTEDSAKKDGRDKSVYNYTPGYRITEVVRAKLIENNVLLKTEVTDVVSDMVEHTVYKVIGGQAVPFNKRENLVKVTAQFTFVDLDTGEEEGPLVHVCQASNGIDKSCVTAISTARRYFFIDFFNIVLKDPADELDAVDSSFLPGVSASEQPANATDYGAAMASRQYGGAQPRQPQYQYPQPPAYIPQQGYAPQPAVQVVQNTFNQPQSRQSQGSSTIPDEKNPKVAEAITALAGALSRTGGQRTSEYATVLNEQVTKLTSYGILVFGNGYMPNLEEAALAQYEGRRPNFR